MKVNDVFTNLREIDRKPNPKEDDTPTIRPVKPKQILYDTDRDNRAIKPGVTSNDIMRNRKESQ